MAMKEDCIALTQEAFDVLPNYSHSIPTGTTIGKQWKCLVKRNREDKGTWYMKEYTTHPDPNMGWDQDSENRHPRSRSEGVTDLSSRQLE